jgi:hypothetical protein
VSTAADIWEVMADEIGSHDHNPLESFVRNGRLAGARVYASPKRLSPEPIEFEISAITLSEAISMETRGEGAVKFVGGVPMWIPSSPQQTPPVRAGEPVLVTLAEWLPPPVR